MSDRILVMSDRETWETFSDDRAQVVLELTPEAADILDECAEALKGWDIEPTGEFVQVPVYRIVPGSDLE